MSMWPKHSVNQVSGIEAREELGGLCYIHRELEVQFAIDMQVAQGIRKG